MDILILLAITILVGIKLDKFTRIGTIAYSIGSFFLFAFYLFISSDPIVSSILFSSFGFYYTHLRTALAFSFPLFYTGFSAILIIQVYFLILSIIGSFVIVKKVVSSVKEILTKTHSSKFRVSKKFPRQSKITSNSKIFIKFCRFNC